MACRVAAQQLQLETVVRSRSPRNENHSLGDEREACTSNGTGPGRAAHRPSPAALLETPGALLTRSELRVPDLRLASPTATPALREEAERWLESRVDVSEGTLQTYRVALGRLIPRLGGTPVAEVDAQMVAALVVELHALELRKQTIRK